MTIEERESQKGAQAEFDALSKVVAAMNSLDREAQERLLKTVAVFLGFGRESFSGQLPSPVSGGAQSAFGGANSSARGDVSFSEDRSYTPKDFMLLKKPTTDIERIACLAYYLTHYRNTPHFRTLDLSKLNTEAAQIKLSNTAKAVDNAARAGLLVQATRGNKQLSAGGELYVQALPDRDSARAAMAQFRQRRKIRGASGRTAWGPEVDVTTETDQQ